jgi:hypothetical protein
VIEPVHPPELSALDEKRCPRCLAAVNRERHLRTCPARAEIIRTAFTPEEQRGEDVLQACTRSAFNSLLPGGRFAELAPRLLP